MFLQTAAPRGAERRGSPRSRSSSVAVIIIMIIIIILSTIEIVRQLI